jgi:molybdopterin synthase sulfur carrier subunit
MIMARVWIPSLLRDLTGGVEQIDVPGRSVRQIIDELERRYPGMRARLCSGESLRSGVAAVVDGAVANLGLMQPLTDDSEVHFLPALSGG